MSALSVKFSSTKAESIEAVRHGMASSGRVPPSPTSSSRAKPCPAAHSLTTNRAALFRFPALPHSSTSPGCAEQRHLFPVVGVVLVADSSERPESADRAPAAGHGRVDGGQMRSGLCLHHRRRICGKTTLLASYGGNGDGGREATAISADLREGGPEVQIRFLNQGCLCK